MSNKSGPPRRNPATPEFAPNEPIEQIRARVHGRLLLLLLAITAIVSSFFVSSRVAQNQPVRTVEECLPPGVSLQTRLGSEAPDVTVGERLKEIRVAVQNGVLVDSEGVPIGFAVEPPRPPDGMPTGALKSPGKKKLGVQAGYRVITISQFDSATPGQGH